MSNLGQTSSSNEGVGTSRWVATQFTTGTGGPWTLSSVRLTISRWDSADSNNILRVSIRAANGNDPGAVHVRLGQILRGPGARTRTFYDVAGTILQSSTSYFVVVSSTARMPSMAATAADGEDSGAATGWSIANTGRQSSDGGISWSPLANSLMLAVLAPNTPAEGDPRIRGTHQVGETLTADILPIIDADGVLSSFSYQWIRVDADGMSNEQDILAATAATYTPVDDDEGKTIKVRVNFNDADGNPEMRTSEPTFVINASVANPLGRSDRGRAGPAEVDSATKFWTLYPLRVPILSGD